MSIGQMINGYDMFIELLGMEVPEEMASKIINGVGGGSAGGDDVKGGGI